MDFFTHHNIKGVIFDCDGVLVDSELLSCGAINVIFEKYFNVDIGHDYSSIIGNRLEDTFKFYLEKFDISIPSTINLTDLYKQKDQEYQNLARGKLHLFPGVEELLKNLINRTIKISVASSGTPEKIKFNLHEGGLTKYFTILTSAVEVQNGKPHPDIFLLSAQKMHLKPENCLVVEDAVAGVKAAKAAGMMAVAVPNTFDKQFLIEAGADKIITRLDELIQ